ncbi:MAG: endolytic transglycosylase MltG [Alphaproteobacteria bacterium]
MKAVKFLGFCALAGLLVLISAAVWFDRAFHTVHVLPENTMMFVEPGSPVAKIARDLETQGFVKSALVFEIGARYIQLRYPDRGGLKAGEYQMPVTAAPRDILRILQMGKTFQRRITIPEGLMAVEIIALINAADAMTGEITDIPPEGSLLPETYHYTRGTKRSDMVSRMQRSMTAALAELWEKRAEGLPLATPQEAIIFASIVEKETAIAAERPRVAGVFVNRLRLGMKLQTDPTVIYAITEGKTRLGRPLLRRDLEEVDSPYNTYKYAGLPPGPIANPGYQSIAAALNPETHDYIFFVADGTGGHAFGKTLQEHNRNVQRWRQIQRSKTAP